jgi:hypothetical protein
MGCKAKERERERGRERDLCCVCDIFEESSASDGEVDRYGIVLKLLDSILNTR